VETLRGHLDEVLDLSFNSTGTKLVTASADSTARVYNVHTSACTAILTGSIEYPISDMLIILSGHEGEISKVSFNPQGTKIITAGADKTARIWSVDTGDELQVLEGKNSFFQNKLLIDINFLGHTDEIFSCAFNYEGDTIITGIHY